MRVWHACTAMAQHNFQMQSLRRSCCSECEFCSTVIHIMDFKLQSMATWRTEFYADILKYLLSADPRDATLPGTLSARYAQLQQIGSS